MLLVYLSVYLSENYYIRSFDQRQQAKTLYSMINVIYNHDSLWCYGQDINKEFHMIEKYIIVVSL